MESYLHRNINFTENHAPYLKQVFVLNLNAFCIQTANNDIDFH